MGNKLTEEEKLKIELQFSLFVLFVHFLFCTLRLNFTAQVQLGIAMHMSHFVKQFVMFFCIAL